MYSSHDIAKIILAFMNNSGDFLTNKKLQKLLYYSEAWSLVYLQSILKEDFEAWVHGPVIPSVYREYKHFGYKPIIIDYECGEEPIERCDSIRTAIQLDENHWNLIKAVLNKYGGLAAFQLENLSHSEIPWKTAREDLGPTSQSSQVIDRELMKTYYSSLITKNGEKEEKR